MANNVRDLRESFPFIIDPSTSNATGLERSLHGVLDARLLITLPAVDLSSCNVHFRVYLASLSERQAVFLVVSGQLPSMSVRVPVYRGRDTETMAEYSNGSVGWVIVDDTATPPVHVPGNSVLLHPDCIVLAQQQVDVGVYMKCEDDSFGSWKSVQGYDYVSVPDTHTVLSATAIYNGYNTVTSFSDDGNKKCTLHLIGGAGLGNGLLPAAAYEDGQELSARKTTGLRTINGMDGACSIVGTGVITVVTDTEDDAVRLTVRVNQDSVT